MARYLSNALEARIQELCAIYLRPMTITGDPVNGVVLSFEPPLTTAGA